MATTKVAGPLVEQRPAVNDPYQSQWKEIAMPSTAHPPIPDREKLDRPLIKPQWAIRATELFIPTDLAADVQHRSRCAPGTRLAQEIGLWMTGRGAVLQSESQSDDIDDIQRSDLLCKLRQAWQMGYRTGRRAAGDAR